MDQPRSWTNATPAKGLWQRQNQ